MGKRLRLATIALMLAGCGDRLPSPGGDTSGLCEAGELEADCVDGVAAGPGLCVTASLIALEAPPLDLDAGDLDGDGDVDLVVDGVEVPGDGTGQFLAADLPDRPEAFAAASVAEVDGDDAADLVVSRAYYSFGGADDVREVNVTMASGESRTLMTTQYPGPSVIGDFDNDGAADLAVQVDGGDVVHCSVAAFLDVRGEPDPITFYPEAEVSVCELWAAPLDDEPGDELVVQDRLEVAQVMSYDGAVFGEATPLVAAGTGITYVNAHALGDVDCDGDLDAVIADDQGLWLAVNDGDLPWTLAWEEPLPILGHAVVLADLDGDGALDAAIATESGVTVVAGVGLEDPGAISELPAGGEWRSILALDANGDGRPDLAGRTTEGIELILSAS